MTALRRQFAATLAARKLPLREFVRQRLGHQWKPAPHLEPLYDLLERSEREEVRAVVSMPPGHAKTETVLVALAWRMARCPSDLHAYVSYSAAATRAKSLRCQEYAEAAGCVPHSALYSAGEWRNVAGGGLLAAGVGGRLTGDRVTGLLVVDDPYRGWQDAWSPTIRARVARYYDGVAYTRLVPDRGSIIVIHTRWTDSDLAGQLGRVVAPDGRPMYETVILRAIDDAGRPLWPEGGYTLRRYGEIRAQLDAENPFLWSALYQQRPTPPEGSLFHAPARYHLHDLPAIESALRGQGRRIIGVDLAASVRASADHTAAVPLLVAGHGADTRAWELDLARWKVEAPESLSRLRALQGAHRCPLAWETNGVGRPMAQVYRRDYAGAQLIEVTRARDKKVAAIPCATAWNAGRIAVPLAPWGEGHVDRARAFTGADGGDDDDLDALVNGWEASRLGGTASGRVAI